MRRAQSALEFVILVSFMLLVFFSFFIIIQERITDISRENDRAFLREVNQLILQQMQVALSSAGDYAVNFTMPLGKQPYDVAIYDRREIVSTFDTLEYVNFLSTNLSGDVVLGTYNDKNTIYKTDGQIVLDTGIIVTPGSEFTGVFLNFNPETCYLATLADTCASLDLVHPNYVNNCQTYTDTCTGTDSLYTDMGSIACWGSTTVDSSWRTITHGCALTDPVVIALPATQSDPDPVTVRLRNVATNSFDITLQEWPYQTGSHGSETVHYLAIEKGTHIVDGKLIVVGNRTLTESFATISFTMYDTPVIFTQIQTNDDEDAITVRQRSISTGSYQARLQQQENLTFIGSHGSEEGGYVIFTPGRYTDATAQFVVNVTGVSYSSAWKAIEHSLGLTPNLLLAQMQTQNGGDTADLRYRSLDSSNVEVFIEEEQSSDSETGHTNEQIGYLVLN